MLQFSPKISPPHTDRHALNKTHGGRLTNMKQSDPKYKHLLIQIHIQQNLYNVNPMFTEKTCLKQTSFVI